MVTRSSMKASISSRKTSLGVPNFLALAWNLVRVLSATRTVRYADLLIGVMTVKIFGVDGHSVAHCDTLVQQLQKEKPRGLVNPGVTLEETSMKKLATAITSEKSI